MLFLQKISLQQEGLPEVELEGPPLSRMGMESREVRRLLFPAGWCYCGDAHRAGDARQP